MMMDRTNYYKQYYDENKEDIKKNKREYTRQCREGTRIRINRNEETTCELCGLTLKTFQLKRHQASYNCNGSGAMKGEYFNLAVQYYKMLEPNNILETLKGATTNEEINTRIEQIKDKTNDILNEIKRIENHYKDIKTNINEREQDIINKQKTAQRGHKRRLNTAIKKHSLTLI